MKPGFTKATPSANRFKSSVVSAASKAQVKPQAACAMKKEVSQTQIQEKAYELFLKRNGGYGSAEDDWLEAERILKGA